MCVVCEAGAYTTMRTIEASRIIEFDAHVHRLSAFSLAWCHMIGNLRCGATVGGVRDVGSSMQRVRWRSCEDTFPKKTLICFILS